MVDAMPRGGAPGTLYVIEPDDAAGPEDGAITIEGHAMDPLRVLRLARSMGAQRKPVLVVGCEPTPLDPDDLEYGCMGLSEPVAAAIDPALELVESVLNDLKAKAVIER